MVISTVLQAGCSDTLHCWEGGAGVGSGAIVCCVGDCDVAMGKLRTSGEFVFCWARCQASVTYYSAIGAERVHRTVSYVASKGKTTLITGP